MKRFLLLTAFIFSVQNLFALPSDLDDTFGSNGMVTTSITTSDKINATVIQSDGKIL